MNAREAIDDMCMDCKGYPCYALKHNDMCYSRRIITETLNGLDKYRWHDLRKDPDDVPTHNDMVLIAIGWQDGDREYYTDRYDNGWIRENFLRLGKIIAWREIEPFEEVDSE